MLRYNFNMNSVINSIVASQLEEDVSSKALHFSLEGLRNLNVDICGDVVGISFTLLNEGLASGFCDKLDFFIATGYKKDYQNGVSVIYRGYRGEVYRCDEKFNVYLVDTYHVAKVLQKLLILVEKRISTDMEFNALKS